MDLRKKPRGYRAELPYKHVEIERVAVLYRKRLFKELTAGEALPKGVKLLEAMESIPIQVDGRQYPLRTEVKALPWPVEAEARFDEEEQCFVIRVSERTYEALTRDDPHARFTICHEFGHVVMHRAQLMRLSCIPHAVAALQRKSAPEHPWYFDTEWQADSFSASLLVPTDGLLKLQGELGGSLTTSSVTQRYGISTKSATIRISNFLKQQAA
jgi:hypothetical protein